jgi:hypothetical protein
VNEAGATAENFHSTTLSRLLLDATSGLCMQCADAGIFFIGTLGIDMLSSTVKIKFILCSIC